MLDPLVYRAAFIPALFAVVLAAFSLTDRPRPMRTTLSAGAFDEGGQAYSRLQQLARQFPARRPGGSGDERLAGMIADQMRGGGYQVVVRSDHGTTIDGKRRLTTVAGTLAGQPGKGIVVIADRSAPGRGAVAQLSATAALAELVRVFEGRATRRTLTLVSTSGGGAGAASYASTLRAATTDAVLVLGDLASARLRKPWVLPWSDGARLAPVRLRRTAEAAVRAETGQDSGGVRAGSQLARLAFPFAIGDEGRFNDRGIPAVKLQATGERGPAANAAVSADHLRVFGRAALRTISALDAGAALDGPSMAVVTRRKVLPRWSVQLLVGALLLPAALAAVDALARVRRRRHAIAIWCRWIATLAFPFVVAAALARLLGLTGIVAAPSVPVAAGQVSGEAGGLIVVGLGFVLAWLAVRPLARAVGVAELAGSGPAAAVGATTAAIATIVWIVNPYAAAVLLLPAHLWLLGSVLPLPRAAAWLLMTISLLPIAAVLVVYARAVGLSVGELPWSLLLLGGSGHVGVVATLTLCALAGCALAAWTLALRGPRSGDHGPSSDPAISSGATVGAQMQRHSFGGTEPTIRLRR